MTFVAPRNKTNRFLLDKNYCQFNMMVFMSQVLTNIVGAIAESARSHENRREGWTCRKWKWTTVAIVTQKQKSEENKHCRELIREQEGLGPVIRLIASTSPGAESIASNGWTLTLQWDGSGLLVNVAAAIGQMAEDTSSLEQVSLLLF